MKTIKPYEHDCDNCVWVGWHCVGDKLFNVYLCGKTVVIRASSEPLDYWSGTAGEGSKGAIGVGI